MLSESVDLSRLCLRHHRRIDVVLIFLGFLCVFFLRDVPLEVVALKVQIVQLFGQYFIIPSGFLAGLIGEEAIFALCLFLQAGDPERINFFDAFRNGCQPSGMPGQNDVVFVYFDGRKPAP